tara:strand:- start:1058 stop:1360 length:303 start_codon:yes stop_codon:yes gene_type:complete
MSSNENYEIDVTQSEANMVNGTMKVTVKVKHVEPEITTVLGEYDIIINKPYRTISSAVHWEIRRKLHQAGISDITFSAEPPEDFIPDGEVPFVNATIHNI